MISDPRTTDLSVDVSSRIEGLLSLVKEIEGRVTASPVLTELLRDFHGMAREYILLFETKLAASEMDGRRKWVLRHEMLDKLTREWHLVYSLACAVELGSSHLEDFRPYVDQAIGDIGLTNSKDTFLLIPVFGEGFSLVKVRYSSSNLAILNLPISVIHSPWELSVIWHEMAGLKVFEIRPKIKDFLDAYALENNLEIPMENALTQENPVTKFMQAVIKGDRLENNFKAKIREYLTLGDDLQNGQSRMWPQDWFEQLYEDACSVFAFGEEFVRVLQTILSRQELKLTADWKHPDLNTRLIVARRLLALQKGSASPPAPGAETLTDNLLWAFINQTRSDPGAALPVAYSDPSQDELPEVRRKLIVEMQTFNRNFGNLDDGTILESRFDLGPMAEFAEKASQHYVEETERSSRVKKKLSGIFNDSDDVEGLLKTPFSPADELNYYDHTKDQFQVMYIGSSTHGAHTVMHLLHK